MKKNLLKALVAGAMMLSTGNAWAVQYPTYPTQTLTDGGEYVLCNLAVPTGYMCRTGWDNAMYFLGSSDFANSGVTVKAHFDAESGNWYFTTTEEYVQDEDYQSPDEADVKGQKFGKRKESDIDRGGYHYEYTYMGIPAGTDNVNSRFADKAMWKVTPSETAGFYTLAAAEGNGNGNCIGLNMHLNSGGQYVVVSERESQWYPDFYGGIKYDEDGQPVIIYDSEDDILGYKVMADSTSMNWAFVAVEDLDSYVAIGTQWNVLNSFEKNYCSIEGYEAGFAATLAAAQAAFDAGNYEDMQALLDAKVELYNQLVKAVETGAAQLAAITEESKAVFDTETSVETVKAAYVALKTACDEYAMGKGDITSLGQNMSFEDLSAQGGNMTTTKSPVPTGWNVYVNGEKLEAGTLPAYGFNWHGVNDDCDSYKDGNYGFGIWAAKVPEYEISQTITGLDNGTYIIKAGLMVADNRRTTQRIFGNFNSTLFGDEGAYVEGLLPAEYKTYAANTETSSEREMQEMTVRAYVYDGTLTFGVKTNGDYKAALRENGYDGDGWFKTDHFTIEKDGFVEEDQTNLYNYFLEQLQDVAGKPMDATYKSKYEGISYENLDEGIPAVAALIAEADAQAQAYEPLGAAIEQAKTRAGECEEVGYKGVGEFWDVIDEVSEAYEGGDYTAEQIAAAVDALDEAYQACLRSGVDEGADVSDLIINRSFEDLRNQGNANSDGTQAAPYGWDLFINGVKCETADEIKAAGINGWCAINGGDNINVTDEQGIVHTHQYTDGTHVWGIWNSNMPSVELSQTITGLEPGTYLLTADVMVDGQNWAGNCITDQRIFGQDVICMYGSANEYIPEYLQTVAPDLYKAYNLTVNEGLLLDPENEYAFFNYGDWDPTSCGSLLRTLSLHFGVDESGMATIGFRTDNVDPWTGEVKGSNGMGWFKLDNFTLYYESSNIPSNIAVGVKNVNVATPAASAIYDLSGRKVSKAVKGIYIIDGKKVVR